MLNKLILVLTDNSELRSTCLPGPRFVRSGMGRTSILLICLGIALTGCDLTVPSPVESESVSWADSVLASMTLEEKVGQMMMVDLSPSGSLSDPDTRTAMKERMQGLQPGGVILFAAEPLETGMLVSWAQHVSSIPLLVALDAEWGAGYRLEGFSRFPDAMALSATGNPDHARFSGRTTARQAATVGINVLFAPTVDVNVNPANPVIGTRAWSDHPDSVVAFAGAFIEGVAEEGLLPVMKHFPGHGGTSRDSHSELPVANSSLDVFERVHVKPFRDLLADSLAAIMSAHIIPEGHLYSDTAAATFSPRILTDLLRDSLGYRGLVFTDALNMAGAASAGSAAERTIKAVLAGADIVLMPPDPASTKLALINAVRSGRISVERIDSSVSRILHRKERLALDQRSLAMDPEGLFAALDDRETTARMRYMAREAVTVLKDDAVLPLSPSSSMAMISIDHRARNRGPEGPAYRFRDELNDRSGQEINLVEVSPGNWTGQIPTILRNAREHDVLVVADYTGNTPVFGWNQVQFLRDIASGPATVVYVSLDKPYALPDIADIPSVILQSYDASDAMAAGTADILFGLAEARGRLPVQVSADWPRGSGLSLPARYAAPGPAETVSLDSKALRELLPLLDRAVADSAFATAAVAVGRDLTVAYQGLHGYHTFDRLRPLEERDLFDLASLTKVISTTTAIMLLVEDGLVDLERPVADYLPAFGQNGKGMVTVRDLLSHVGGLIPFVPFHMQGVRSGAEVRRRILSDSLAYEPGSTSRYSDFGPITLAWMTEAITGERFDQFVARRVFEPLTMVDTGYRSNSSRNIPNAVPTETDDYFRFRTLQGEVHDETAWLLGGTAGHAGLFSTVRDLTRFAGMLARDGRVGDTVFIRPETLRRFATAVDEEGRHTRALGWDTKSMHGYSSAGSRFGPRSFGHTGFTGTSFWYDPDTHLYVILLTNRVYPTRDNRKHIPVRPAVADVAFKALDAGLIRNKTTAE